MSEISAKEELPSSEDNQNNKPEENKRYPLPSCRSIKLLGGEISELQEVMTDQGAKMVHLIKKGGGLIQVEDKKEWAGVLNHTLLVYRVATYLARLLIQRGENIDLNIISDIALDHDVAKRQEDEHRFYNLGKCKGHAELGANMMRKANFSESAIRAVEVHFLPTPEELDTWENKILFYADFRASAKIIPLKERLERFHNKYVDSGLMTEEYYQRAEYAYEIEKEIFAILDIQPDDLNQLPPNRFEKYFRELVKRNLEERGIRFLDRYSKQK